VYRLRFFLFVAVLERLLLPLLKPPPFGPPALPEALCGIGTPY
jgi:hypothetical protein